MDYSKIIKGVGSIVSLFNPALGGSFMMVGALADEFDGIPDDTLENNFIGFSKSAEIIRSVAENLDGVDREKLLDVAKNLDGMNNLLEKFVKLFK